MPLIAPAEPPPPPVPGSVSLKHHSETNRHPVPSSTKHGTSSPSSSPRKGGHRKSGREEEENTVLCRIPTVKLDIDVVTDSIAAKLATSFLGHILFLKSQVPFPVLQLARLPGAKADSRAAKQKRELLDSFDTISSHLVTTFTALSTALARSKLLHEPTDAVAPTTKTVKRVGRVYMAIILGPSIGTAKTKVIFGIDGLEVKIWGERSDISPLVSRQPREEEIEDETADTDEEEEEEVDSEDEVGELEEELGSDGSDGEVPEESDSEEERDVQDEANQAEDENETPEIDDSPVPPPAIPARPPTPPRSHSTGPKLMSVDNHAEEQQAIRLADRLLSRTLATTEGEGRGMAAELALTQTHVLIRAPRRFNHPAWIPRQNLSKSLDTAVVDFLGELGTTSSSRDPQNGPNKKVKNRHPVEGVWVTASKRRGEGEEGEYEYVDVTRGRGPEDQVQTQGTDVDEQDEMIWWSWDGKLVGTGGI
ncbi:hypothetical protein VKT23_009425 [Stygiomarasmius scandens]|uniref:Uncharacterized protein n=1 Tax=Marasmiellus scandens TaxID=2682957 RepID=A0ABR1JHU7_9AGAR